MAVLYIKDLVVEAKHGVNPEEKTTLQQFKINVKMTVDTDKAGRSDDLSDTVNWSDIRKSIIHTVKSNTFNLMERLAKEIADQILNEKRITRVVVEIEKLDAFQTGVPGIIVVVGRDL
jgi:FolB domain-containing protein